MVHFLRAMYCTSSYATYFGWPRLHIHLIVPAHRLSRSRKCLAKSICTWRQYRSFDNMRETITVSASHQANHVATHLFNNQESHLVYKKGVSSRYQNSVYLVAQKTALGSTNYYPRAMLYDLSGGNGALGKFEYFRAADGESMAAILNTSDVIRSFPAVEKNEYQRALDSGTSITTGLLNTDNTSYWSDYNKLIYNPKSLNFLSDWVHDPLGLGYHRSSNEEKKRFDMWYLGINEAKKDIDEKLEVFRQLLEDSDMFQGANFFTEIDSAWGGFTAELLSEIKDEYFNGHAKHSFWTWAMFNLDEESLNFKQKYSRIRGFVDLVTQSSMMFPMAEPSRTVKSSVLSDSYDTSSPWHTSALKAYVIDSLWAITNPLHNWTTMNTFEENMIREGRRNIVGDIKLMVATDGNNLSSENEFGMVSATNPYDLYNIKSATEEITNSSTELLFSDGIFSPKDAEYFSRSYIVPHDATVDIEVLNHNQIMKQELYSRYKYPVSASTMKSADSFPPILTNLKLFSEFSIGTQPRQWLKNSKQFLQKSSRITVQMFETDYEEHSELVEMVGDLLEEYTVRWEDDEEWE